ncbi:GNAT family N-acetyltransferase [uncultured Proteiniphilum sp.]|uniref:GNAT family N-acetyltransferase n=1 Tax=uncultured Proteiniphilum sp. TaxID=497637 RepID=UPI0026304538|nr:GNAT family N-acetyltransferase [uncultured Proteiniphilum sp.]
MEIKQIDTGGKGVFKAADNGKEAGKMTYVRAGEKRLIIDHTEVRPEYAGKGVGKQLVVAAVEYARDNDMKILPLCPFAKRIFDKTPGIRDVL